MHRMQSHTTFLDTTLELIVCCYSWLQAADQPWTNPTSTGPLPALPHSPVPAARPRPHRNPTTTHSLPRNPADEGHASKHAGASCDGHVRARRIRSPGAAAVAVLDPCLQRRACREADPVCGGGTLVMAQAVDSKCAGVAAHHPLANLGAYRPFHWTIARTCRHRSGGGAWAVLLARSV